MDPETSTMKIYSRGGNVSVRHALRRLGREQEEVFFLSLVEQQSRFDPVAGKPVPQDEIPVAPGMLVGSSSTFAMLLSWKAMVALWDGQLSSWMGMPAATLALMSKV